MRAAAAEVTLLTFQGLIDGSPPPGVEHRILLDEIGLLSALLRALRRPRPLRWFLAVIEYTLTVIRGLQLYRRERFDVIHLRDGEPLVILAFVALQLAGNGASVLCMPNDTGIAPPHRLWSGEDILRQLNRSKWARRLYRRALAGGRIRLMCLNDAMKAAYEAALDGVFDGHVVTIPFGYDLASTIPDREAARRRLGLPSGRRLLLAFGAFHGWKDPQTVIRGLHRIDGVVLVHAGATLDRVRDDLLSLVQKLGLAERVILRTGWIPEAEKPHYFAAADGVVLSYRPSGAFPSALWDACRFRRPVLFGGDSRMKDLVHRYGVGLTFQSGDPASFRNAVVRFLGLVPEEVDCMQRNCERFCRDFSAGAAAQACLRLYEELTRAP